jgi:hypothetical protein
MNAFGISIGFVFFIISLFVSDSNTRYLLASLGIAIIFCSIAMFIFGLFLSLMGEYTENRKVKA